MPTLAPIVIGLQSLHDWKSNILPVAGFVALGALTIWFIVSFTPWLGGLPFNPWWLMVPVVGVCVLVLFLTSFS